MGLVRIALKKPFTDGTVAVDGAARPLAGDLIFLMRGCEPKAVRGGAAELQ